MAAAPEHQETPDLQQTPLAGALCRLAGEEREIWHMPGHYGTRAWPDWLKNNLSRMDTTELPMTDDLNRPTGPARQAMALAAEAFGAGVTRFITSGTTTAIQIMLALACGRRGSLLLPRSVHMSIVHAAALLDLNLCWLESSELPDSLLPFSLLPRVTASAVEQALVRNPGCRAVFVTSPDYYGVCPDLAAIADVAHRHDVILLVDEAHGAHLAFGGDLLPTGAMSAGADICVQSGHKTLPVLTPGAMIHLSAAALSAGRIDASGLDRLIPVFQTSSPSFPIAATLDYARSWLQASGNQAVIRQLGYLDQFEADLPEGLSCSSRISGRDPLRLVIAVDAEKTGIAAGRLAQELAAGGIDIEFADLTRLVLIPSLVQPEAAWQQLAASLRQIIKDKDRSLRQQNLLSALESEWRYWLSARPESAMPPGDALLVTRQLRQVPLLQAAGLISARAVLPYPPGIPLIWPGEYLCTDRVDFLRRLMENNISITGIDEQRLWVLA